MKILLVEFGLMINERKKERFSFGKCSFTDKKQTNKTEIYFPTIRMKKENVRIQYALYHQSIDIYISFIHQKSKLSSK